MVHRTADVRFQGVLGYTASRHEINQTIRCYDDREWEPGYAVTRGHQSVNLSRFKHGIG